MIDRHLQKTRTYSGITGVNTQDFALQEGMGPIVDRSLENLGTSDRAIVQMRRQLLEATDAVTRGEAPRGVDPAKHRNVRPHDGLIAGERDWHEAFEAELIAKW